MKVAKFYACIHKYHELDTFDLSSRNDALLGRIYNLLPSFDIMMGGRGIQGDLPGFAGSQGKEKSQKIKKSIFQANSETGQVVTINLGTD